MDKIYLSAWQLNNKTGATAVEVEPKEKNKTVYIYPGDTYLGEQHFESKVLFFTKYIEHFIVVVSSEDDTEILQLVQRLAKATGYTWDRATVIGYEHNKAIDDFQSQFNDEP